MNAKRLRLVEVPASTAFLALSGAAGSVACLLPRGSRLVGVQQRGQWLTLKLWRADWAPVPEAEVIPYYRAERDGP